MRVLAIGLLAAVYVASGHLGLMLDAVSGFATLVWAPTGISVAALRLFGLRLWPGVALGAFLVNIWEGAPWGVAGGIALGNSLEAVIAASLLRRRAGLRSPLGGLGDVLSLVLATVLATAVSATLGVASLFFGGLIVPGSVAVTWLAWWVGDEMGALVVTPLILTWRGEYLGWTLSRGIEALALLATLSAAGVLIFFRPAQPETVTFLQPYILFAPLLWAALRFETRGAATATFLVSALAVAGAVRGLGPFQSSALAERLWALQAFMGMMALTFLLLAALVKERRETEAALLAAKESAESSSGAKSRFLAVMSHELRTPLTSIIGYADLIESGVAGPINTTQKQHLQRVRAAGWHLVSIIDGILTFSRAEAGQERVILEKLDAAMVVEEVAALLQPQAVMKGLELRTSVTSRPLEICTDAGKLRQILLNLAGNAVKFSLHGVVSIELSEEGGAVFFRVLDQGPGIKADQLTMIFEPFNQVGHGDSGVSSGTGLGLSVAARLAELLHGTVSVESTVGQGSTFTLRLPRDSGAYQPSAPSSM